MMNTVKWVLWTIPNMSDIESLYDTWTIYIKNYGGFWKTPRGGGWIGVSANLETKCSKCGSLKQFLQHT